MQQCVQLSQEWGGVSCCTELWLTIGMISWNVDESVRKQALLSLQCVMEGIGWIVHDVSQFVQWPPVPHWLIFLQVPNRWWFQPSKLVRRSLASCCIHIQRVLISFSYHNSLDLSTFRSKWFLLLYYIEATTSSLSSDSCSSLVHPATAESSENFCRVAWFRVILEIWCVQSEQKWKTRQSPVVFLCY